MYKWRSGSNLQSPIKPSDITLIQYICEWTNVMSQGLIIDVRLQVD